ncbi:VCBS repeat-containing protein [Chryseolinea lacunae]|uniref:VCBS repeat-containing protein n=1 Tax=Chryseolinea lacunae TaxID=2801331 RepID=A0ABS1KKP5_9BACT|nr:VCBS repeat-containing protein [Chryseolinea lacunae]MBL0739802.1 VCBS repeat-containing protein [Chryseolinea lacunae]
MMAKGWWTLLPMFLWACQQQTETLFTQTNPTQTGVTFANTVVEDDAFNILTYEYLYNGGGVAAGDLNNDGKIDLLFTGNAVPNALYLNKGNWKFEDIAATAGLGGRPRWKTGVTLADVNADGLLDIYVCYSGPGTDTDRCNELFINNGGDTPTFTERAAEYGLDACGTYSTQASFFDYDRDGDLDMFLLNHARLTYNPFFNSKKLRALRHPQYGNRLYRNDDGKYQDVSAAAGIHGSGVNFGLGVSVADMNEDGWPDLYVTNDYEEQDFFYLNQRNGTFREGLKESFRHIARNGMGCDVADYNNDGLPDVVVVDMLPEDNFRQKILKGPDEFDKYNLLRDSGYHHQNMRNVLQLNMGMRDSVPVFSEVGQLAGMSNTDWSWSPLLADYDNDGRKDLFITNGFLRDFTNLDFVKYVYQDSRKNGKPYEIVKQLPSSRISNYLFRNNGDLTFQNTTEAWGLQEKSISNGAVYADLDNDGDLDLITNNINQQAFLFRNNTDGRRQHFIKIKLKGEGANTFAIGAKIGIVTDNQVQVQELFPTRGFQSCMPAEIIFGLGNTTVVDSLWVMWPSGKVSARTKLKADTTFVLTVEEAVEKTTPTRKETSSWFENEFAFGAADRYVENDFIDYKIQFLLPYQVSRYGPCLASGDIDGDGNDDLFVGGASGHSGKLYRGTDAGFVRLPAQPWRADSLGEDTGALLFDADGDGDEDLYVVRGGTEFPPEAAPLLQDRLYENVGHGKFAVATEALPHEISNGSCVSAADYDKDGDLDLFIGARSIPGNFPMPSVSFLLRNDSQGGVLKFTNATPQPLRKPGMVTSAVWMDYNNDTWPDLILAGEFMPVMVFENMKGVLTDNTVTAGTANTAGLWCRLISADVDADGDLDVVAGNAGLNLSLKATPDQPITLHYGDFNGDGRIDPILSTHVQGKPYPYPSRDEMLEQLPALKRKFTSYELYANAKLEDVIGAEQLKQGSVVRAVMLASCIFKNVGNGKFETMSLPVEAQFSMNSAMAFDDFDADGVNDMLLAGNFYPYRVQAGRSDAGSGLILKGGGLGKYTPTLFPATGFYAPGDVRALAVLKTKTNERRVVLGVNDGVPLVFRYKTKQ